MAGMIPYSNGRNQRSLFPWGMFNDFIPQTMDVPTSFTLDVEDTDDTYIVTASLPGVAKDDINVEISEGRLSISVDKKETEEQKSKTYLHKETCEWSATRGVYLKDASCEGLSAKLADGILTVEVPKVQDVTNVTKIEIE